MGELITTPEYSSSVHIGNWFEELCLVESGIQEFLKKRESGELALQKTRKLFSNFFKEVTLPYVHKMRFGTNVQLIPTRMNICNDFSKYKPALSINIQERMINQGQQISDRCELSIAPSLKPCVRNTFTIRSPDKKDRTGEKLKYGQDFILECVEAEEQPLVLFCSPKSANLTNVTKSTYKCISNKGEENLPVGLCLLRDTGSEGFIRLGDCRWKCLHKYASMRFETEGQTVQSNTELVITHSATNQNLAAENLKISTLFGTECLVCAHSYIDIHKREMWQNYWMLGTSQAKNI